LAKTNVTRGLNDLQFIDDGRVKGSGIIFCLDPEGHFTVRVIEGGRRLSVAGIPNSLHDHLLFFESRNQKRSLKGTICAMLPYPLSFDQLKPGPLYNFCCFGLVEGYFFKDGILNFVMHHFKLREGQNLPQLIAKYGNDGRDMIKFAREVFVAEPLVVNESEMSLIPLCQIHGPQMRGWGVDRNISRENSGDFFQCCLQPNRWTTSYLHEDTASRFPFLKTPQMQWIKTRKPVVETLVEHRSKKRRLSPPTQPMQNSHKNPTHVYFCRRNKDIASKKKSYTMAEYFPCYGQFSNDKKYFVPITPQQRLEIKNKFNNLPNEEMSMDDWNSMLESMLKVNGFDTPVEFASINIIDPEEQWIVSILDDNEDLASCPHVMHQVTNSVTKITLPSNVRDHEMSHGIVDSRMFVWPFQDSISGDWLDVVDANTSGPGLIRKCTGHEGSFEIFDERKTSQASGSLFAAPGQTKHHHHHRKSFNRTIHILAKAMLNSLGDETVATTYSCGESLMTIMKNSLGMRERSQVCPRLIISKGFSDETGWFNYLHRDNDFGSKEATAKAVKLIESLPCDLTCGKVKRYYLHRYFKCTKQTNYCRATTCCWKVMEKDDNFVHRQYFVNTTCGVVYNLSSNVFTDDIHQLGATFYGGLSEHCTSMPVFVSTDGLRVRIRPNGRNYNLGWGKSH
jgi:hypothetical protein